ncbi:TonB-dependent receptor plug domain-containing protein [Phenylobacterium sp.]|uniref:TonB-dependent receptor plug domain-containing protein n=1 Tax=Phenylobacterium sp. TaxID=1871053 RepID=UPI002EDB5C2B
MIGLILAQAIAAAAPAEGVIAYPPAFFAARQPDTARDMIERLPGFLLESGSGARGFEGTAGNVLIDGQRPASKTDGLYDILGRISASKVARIEVIRGGGPGIDMQGRAVVANVVLKKDAAVRGHVQAEAQHAEDGRSFGGLNGQASGGSDGRKWEVSGLWGRGFSGLVGPATGVTLAPSGVSRFTIESEDDGWIEQATGAYEVSLAGGTLRLNGRYYGNHLKFEEDSRDVATGAVRSTDQTYLDDEREAGARFTRPLSSRATLELVALAQSDESTLTSGQTSRDGEQRFRLDRETQEIIGRAVVKFSWNPALSLEAGGEAAHNRLDSQTAFAVDGTDVSLPGADVVVEEDRGELFGKASWRVSPRLSLDGSIRYERSTVTSDGDVRLEKTLSYLKPRLVGTWSPDEANQLRVRVEREVGQLNFNDFVAQASLNTDTGVTAGNVDLEPERAWVVEAAFERRFWGRGSVILTARRFFVSGVVDRGPVFTSGGVFDRPTNIGDGRKDILRMDLTLPLDKTGLKGAQLKGYVVKRWSRVDDPTTGERRQISNLRHMEWEAHFTQDLPAWNLTWGVSGYGGWQVYYYRFNAVDEQKLDPFVMVFGEWRPRPDISVRAEVGNLTNRGFRRVTLTHPGPRNGGLAPTLTERETYFGRNYFLRVRKSFGG